MPQKITISNWFVAVYFLYIGFNIITEWIYFFSWGVEISPSFGVPQTAAAVLLGVFVWLTQKHWKISALEINREQIVGMTMIFLYGSVMSVYSDIAPDTFSYHLLAQNPEFINYFQSMSNSGFYVVWSFSLSDQLFYYFRYLLGYRMGTMLNTIVAIVAFLQIYALLGRISTLRDRGNSRMERILSCRLLWTFLILLPMDAVAMFGVYYIDLLSIPIGLEVFRLLLVSRNNMQKNEMTVYFVFLNGCWIALKLTNIIYVIPCIFVYLYYHGREISWKAWMLSVACFFIPFFEYLAFDYICTGNPLYPWYNAIFQSPYYPIENFKDTRWGPKNFFEGVFWIFFVARQSEMPDWIPVGSFFGLFGAIVLSWHYWRMKQSGAPDRCGDTFASCRILIVLALTAMFLWNVTTGYGRYYIFGKMLWGGVFCIFAMWMWRHTKWGKKIALTCMALACVALALSVGLSAAGRNWSWSGFHTRLFVPELQFVLRDRAEQVPFPQQADLFLLSTGQGVGLAHLVAPEVPALWSGWKSLAPSYYSQFYQYRMQEEGKVFDLRMRDMKGIEEYIRKLNEDKFYITHISTESSRIGRYLLISIKPMTDQKNRVWLSDEGTLLLDIMRLSGEAELSLMYGTFMNVDRSGKEKHIRITMTKRGGEEEEIADLPLDISCVDTMTIPIVLDGTQENIHISACYADGRSLDASDKNKVFVINPSIHMMTNEEAR